MLLMTSGVYSAFFGLFILTLLAVRDWLQGGKCQSKARMDGKVVVITGANAGIGYETAKDLSMRGAKVIMGSRNLEKSQKAAKKISDLTKNSVTRKERISTQTAVHSVVVFFTKELYTYLYCKFISRKLK